jgi:hypothetical protein
MAFVQRSRLNKEKKPCGWVLQKTNNHIKASTALLHNLTNARGLRILKQYGYNPLLTAYPLIIIRPLSILALKCVEFNT